MICNINCLQVTWRAYMLGYLFSSGAAIAWFHLYNLYYLSIGLYLVVLSWFHFGEYLSTALFHPSIIKIDAFILNHSHEYNIALLLSAVEHALLPYFFPSKFVSYDYFKCCEKIDGSLS